MKSFLVALRYLTILPGAPRGGAEDDALSRSLPWFPVIGLLLGVVASAFAWCTPHVFPDLPSAVLIVILMAVAGGGTSLVGLAQSADRLCRRGGGAADRPAQAGIGAIAAAAIACSLMIKAAGVAEVPDLFRWKAVLLIPLAGRCAMALAGGILAAPAAGAEGRLAFVIRSAPGRGLCAIWAAAVLVAVACGMYALPDPLDYDQAAWLARGLRGITAAGVCIVTTLVLAGCIRLRGGRAHADTLGAICEIAEAVTIVCLVSYELIDPFRQYVLGSYVAAAGGAA